MARLGEILNSKLSTTALGTDKLSFQRGFLVLAFVRHYYYARSLERKLTPRRQFLTARSIRNSPMTRCVWRSLPVTLL